MRALLASGGSLTTGDESCRTSTPHSRSSFCGGLSLSVGCRTLTARRTYSNRSLARSELVATLHNTKVIAAVMMAIRSATRAIIKFQRSTGFVSVMGVREQRLTTPSSATAERGAVAAWWSEGETYKLRKKVARRRRVRARNSSYRDARSRSLQRMVRRCPFSRRTLRKSPNNRRTRRTLPNNERRKAGGPGKHGSQKKPKSRLCRGMRNDWRRKGGTGGRRRETARKRRETRRRRGA